jgi:hypothetical protein
MANNAIDGKADKLNSNPKNVEAARQTETTPLKLPDEMSHIPMIDPKDLI